MADVHFSPNSANLEKLLDKAARRIATHRAQDVVAEVRARTESSVVLGYTVSGSGYRDIVARIETDDPELVFAEEGTKPHIIRARNGRVLRFPGTNGFSGKTIHVALVHHPGTRGKHTLRNALQDVISRRG